MSGDNKETRFRGAGVSPGLARSVIHVVRDDLDDVPRYNIEPSQIGNEIARFLPYCSPADFAATNSPRVMAMFGLPSIAEAAALTGAGPSSILLVARMSDGRASCAIAGKKEP